jgi:hypothetical protein
MCCLPVASDVNCHMPMHLLRTRPLVAKLAAGKVSNTEKAHYLLASFLMFTIAYYSGFVSGNPVWTLPSILEGLTIAGVTAIGLVKAFDASDFIAQFTCLYVPISISTMLVVWSTFWVTTIGFRESLIAISQSHMQFAVNLSRLGADMFSFLAFAAAVTVQGVTFYRITNSLADVSALKNDG